MIIALAVVLVINAVYNFVVWPRFWKRITTDPRARNANGGTTTFYRVHAILIGIALLIAAVSLVLGVIGLIVR